MMQTPELTVCKWVTKLGRVTMGQVKCEGQSQDDVIAICLCIGINTRHNLSYHVQLAGYRLLVKLQ